MKAKLHQSERWAAKYTSLPASLPAIEEDRTTAEEKEEKYLTRSLDPLDPLACASHNQIHKSDENFDEQLHTTNKESGRIRIRSRVSSQGYKKGDRLATALSLVKNIGAFFIFLFILISAHN